MTKQTAIRIVGANFIDCI